MADGDEIHANLPRRYLNNYRDICAPQSGFNPEDNAHALARTVIKDANNYGNPPVNFMVECVEKVFDKLPSEPLLRQSVNYASLQLQIDKIARQHFGNEQGMDLAKRAARNGLEDYRHEGSIPTLTNVFENYYTNIHQARFSKRVPLTTAHLNGLPATEVDRRLNEILPYSKQEYKHLAKSLARNPDVKKRHPRRSYNQGLGLHDEVW